MDKHRKHLKEYSVLILIFTAISFARIVIDACIYGFTGANLPITGIDPTLVKLVAIIFFIICIIFLLPDVYVGFKGMKEADKTTGAKAHIVWSLVLSILSLVATISAILSMFTGFDFGKLIEVLDTAVDTALFYVYYITAKKVAGIK